MAVLFLLGFSSGLPLMLDRTDAAGVADRPSSRARRHRRLSSVGLAYTFKFAWAPLLDRYQLPLLGRRRGWVLVFQLALVGGLLAMACVDPRARRRPVAAVAVRRRVVLGVAGHRDRRLHDRRARAPRARRRLVGLRHRLPGRDARRPASLALVLADHVVWPVDLPRDGGPDGRRHRRHAARRGAGRARAAAHARRRRSSCRSSSSVGRLGGAGAILCCRSRPRYQFGDYFAQSLMIAFCKRGIGFRTPRSAREQVGRLRRVADRRRARRHARRAVRRAQDDRRVRRAAGDDAPAYLCSRSPARPDRVRGGDLRRQHRRSRWRPRRSSRC